MKGIISRFIKFCRRAKKLLTGSAKVKGVRQPIYLYFGMPLITIAIPKLYLSCLLYTFLPNEDCLFLGTFLHKKLRNSCRLILIFILIVRHFRWLNEKVVEANFVVSSFCHSLQFTCLYAHTLKHFRFYNTLSRSHKPNVYYTTAKSSNWVYN